MTRRLYDRHTACLPTSLPELYLLVLWLEWITALLMIALVVALCLAQHNLNRYWRTFNGDNESQNAPLGKGEILVPLPTLIYTMVRS